MRGAILARLCQMEFSNLKTLALIDSSGRVVCDRCELADTVLSRMRGLIGRAQLPRGRGLLIQPTWSVHTAFMRFPIDVVFLDRELKVLAIRPELVPWRAAVHGRAHSVLELAAGECEALGLRVGDRLAWGFVEPGA